MSQLFGVVERPVDIDPNFVDPHKSIKQALDTMAGINPKARIAAIWMGDNWQGNEGVVMSFNDATPKIDYYRKRNDAWCDSVIVFSDGHKILARTDEQARRNPPPRLGKADAGNGSTNPRANRKGKRKGK